MVLFTKRTEEEKEKMKKENNNNIITIYTDGACSGNPGKGGYGVVLKYKDNEKHLSQGFKLTTNNRMELLAVISGLEALKQPLNDKEIEIITDSKYVSDAINKGWLFNWIERNEYLRTNFDLWKRLYNLLKVYRSVNFVWIKGHSGHHYNEICDRLAVKAYKERNILYVDEGYKSK